MAGRGWDFLHGHLGDAAVQDGDFVHIALRQPIARYSSRTMQCVGIGPADP